jgi:predicted MPP superfamily phosphohydrolase
MPSALTRNHFIVLKDQMTRVSLRGETMDLIGIRFWTRRTTDITRVMKRAGETSILLAHDPRRLTEAAALDIPAVLSGHTHGGQVVLPGLGAIARRNFPVVAGLARQDNTSLFVSRGIGTVYVPMRVNCPPEVAVVTLRRQSDI